MTSTLGKEYKKLIEQFPLRPIKNAKEYNESLAMMKELAWRGNKLTKDETDYLVILSRIVSDYENELPEIKAFMKETKEISPRDILANLIEDNELTVSGLAEETDMDRTCLSSFLSGNRGISKVNAMKLAKRFKVSVELFIS